jgi:hypothetical protein
LGGWWGLQVTGNGVQDKMMNRLLKNGGDCD